MPSADFAFTPITSIPRPMDSAWPVDLDGDEDVLLNDYVALYVIRGLTNLGTDVLDPDSDGDGLLDGEETYVHATSPTCADSDFDGASDPEEIDAGTDPLDPLSFPVPEPSASLQLAAALWTLGWLARRRCRA